MSKASKRSAVSGNWHQGMSIPEELQRRSIEYESSSSEEEYSSRRPSKVSARPRVSVRKERVIDLEEPGLKHVETFKSIQNDSRLCLKNKLARLMPFGNKVQAGPDDPSGAAGRHSFEDKMLELSPAMLKKNNTYRHRFDGPKVDIMNSDNFDDEYQSKSGGGSDSSSFRSDSVESDSVSASESEEDES